MKTHNEEIKRQFNLRASTFDQSVHWVRDPAMLRAHVQIAGPSKGTGVEICCGTGAVARALSESGWDMIGVDLSEAMVEEARKHVKAEVADAVALPFADRSLDLAVMRQAYFLLNDGPAALREVRRVLKPGGKFILSHLVPFSEVDSAYLQKIHTKKQAQLRLFHTPETLKQELQDAQLKVGEEKYVVVRESVSRWMRQAPELSWQTQEEVCNMVLNAPPEYKKLRRVELVENEILEDWNFVLLLAFNGMKTDAN